MVCFRDQCFYIQQIKYLHSLNWLDSVCVVEKGFAKQLTKSLMIRIDAESKLMSDPNSNEEV